MATEPIRYVSRRPLDELPADLVDAPAGVRPEATVPLAEARRAVEVDELVAEDQVRYFLWSVHRLVDDAYLPEGLGPALDALPGDPPATEVRHETDAYQLRVRLGLDIVVQF